MWAETMQSHNNEPAERELWIQMISALEGHSRAVSFDAVAAKDRIHPMCPPMPPSLPDQMEEGREALLSRSRRPISELIFCRSLQMKQYRNLKAEKLLICRTIACVKQFGVWPELPMANDGRRMLCLILNLLQLCTSAAKELKEMDGEMEEHCLSLFMRCWQSWKGNWTQQSDYALSYGR